LHYTLAGERRGKIKMKLYRIFFLNTIFVLLACPVEFVFYSTGVPFACYGGAWRSRMVENLYVGESKHWLKIISKAVPQLNDEEKITLTSIC